MQFRNLPRETQEKIAEHWLDAKGVGAPTSDLLYNGVSDLGDEFQEEMKMTDPQGHFTGSVSVPVAHPKPAQHGTFVGNATVSFVGGRSDDLTITGTGVLASAGSSVCLSFSGRSLRGHGAQIVEGTFRLLGGTGVGARIHASGRFVVFGKKILSKTASTYSLWRRTMVASRGPARGLSATCRAAMKPPKPAAISATLDGFAFAPAGAKTLPPGTTVYPANSTISGAVGCGADNNLYVVVSYTGPPGAGFYLSYLTDSGAKGGPPPATLKPGMNLVQMVSAPANDVYHLAQAAVTPPSGGIGGVSLTGSVTLARQC